MTERERVHQAALEAVRLQGCVCNPKVTLHGSAGLYRASVAHDDWCPLAPDRAKRGQPDGAVVFVRLKDGERQ